MRMLQPHAAPLRRHFLPGLKIEYSVSSRQRAYRVQIHRIQVGATTKCLFLSPSLRGSFQSFSWIYFDSWIFFLFLDLFSPFTDPESAARIHLPLRLLPCKTTQIHHHGFRHVFVTSDLSFRAGNVQRFPLMMRFNSFIFPLRAKTSN